MSPHPALSVLMASPWLMDAASLSSNRFGRGDGKALGLVVQMYFAKITEILMKTLTLTARSWPGRRPRQPVGSWTPSSPGLPLRPRTRRSMNRRGKVTKKLIKCKKTNTFFGLVYQKGKLSSFPLIFWTFPHLSILVWCSTLSTPGSVCLTLRQSWTSGLHLRTKLS